MAPIIDWLPRMALFLSVPLSILLLIGYREFTALVGASVFCIVVELLTPELRRLGPRPVVCSLPLVAGGFVRAPARTAFVAFLTGYFGYALSNIADAAAFLGLLVLLFLDTVFFQMLECFPPWLMIVTAAISITAGALYRYSLYLGAQRSQSRCHKQRRVRGGSGGAPISISESIF